MLDGNVGSDEMVYGDVLGRYVFGNLEENGDRERKMLIKSDREFAIRILHTQG